MPSLLQIQFKDHMILRGFSKDTQRTYISAMRGLVRHYNKSPRRITNDEIQQYILFLIKVRKREHSTINVIFSAITLFYKEILRWNETKFYLPPRVKKSKLPEILSEDEVESLLIACKNIKERAILLTMFDAGLRTSEVTHLQISNIDSKRMTIKVVQGKGGKDRQVILSPTLLHVLRLYWKTYRPSSWLFSQKTNQEKPIDKARICNMYSKARLKAGIKKKTTPHSLRHCFATLMLEANNDLQALQILMGHSSITSTARYLHLTRRRIEKLKTPVELIKTKNIFDPS